MWLLILQIPCFILIATENYLAATALLLCALSVAFIFNNPVNGLILLPFFLFLPFEIPGLGEIRFSQVGTFIVLASFVCSIMLTRTDLDFDFPAFAPVVLILVAMCLSMVNAKFLTESLKIILKFVASFFTIFLFTVNFVKDKETVIRIFISFIISGFLASIVGIYRYLNGFDPRVMGLLGGGFGAFLGTSILMAINMLVFSTRRPAQIISLALLPLLMTAMVLSQTRAWFFGFLLALLFTLFNIRKAKSLRFTLIVGMAAVVTTVLLSAGFFSPTQSYLLTEGAGKAFQTGISSEGELGKYVSTLMRLFTWIHFFSLFLQYPILGYGIGNLRIKNYFSGELGNPAEPQVGYLDNHWLNVLYETGILGAVGWLWFVLVVFKICRQLIRSSTDPEWKAIALALSGSMLIFLFGGIFWVLTVAHEMTAVIPFLIGLAFASLRIIETENKGRT